MSTILSIAPDKLARLIGTPKCPALIDVRLAEEFDFDPYIIPGSVRRSHDDLAAWSGGYAGRAVVVICRNGLGVSPGVSAWLRSGGAAAEVLEGGSEAWRAAKLPRVPAEKVPQRDPDGRTVWVTRERPKIDRIACPWLIRRFVDPSAAFLFVGSSQVEAVAETFGATPFDIERAYWSHRGDKCTFDVMIEELGLASDALKRLALIVRAADTARLDLAPESYGLLAASLGLSRMYGDDHEQLEAGMTLYDAFYRWRRDATGETHNWPTNKPRP